MRQSANWGRASRAPDRYHGGHGWVVASNASRSQPAGLRRWGMMGLGRNLRFLLAAIALVGGCLAAPLARAADGAAMLRQAHAWARFGQGAWRQVRIVTESFDDKGQLTNSSSTDNITTVQEVGPDHVTLKVEVTVEVEGKRFPSQPQTLRQGFAGENVGQTVSFKPLEAETVVVGGRPIACEAQQIEIVGGASKEVTQISYSPQVIPPILRRKTTLSDAASGKTTQEALAEVLAIDVRHRVLGEPKRAYRVQTLQTTDRGATSTVAVHVSDIPGEIVEQTSKKLDSEGRLERRSRLELVGYGVQEEAPRDAGGRRSRRYKRGR